VRFAFPNDFKKNKKRIELHFELMIKVRSGCGRRRIDAKELTVKPLAWLFADAVFKRLDDGDVKILYRALEKKKRCTDKSFHKT